MSTIVLSCPTYGGMEVDVENIHPYEQNGDGTATYGFDCMRCLRPHVHLHADACRANALRRSGVSTRAAFDSVVSRVVRLRVPVDESDIMGFVAELEAADDVVGALQDERPI